ncbi:MAG: FecR family protein [Bacteroidota bacterium]
MQNINKKYWDLIAKQLAGEASVREVQELTAWRSNSPENEKLFIQAKRDWNMLRKADVIANIDVDNAWQKQLQRIKPSDNFKDTGVSSIRKSTFYRVAAFVALFLTIGLSLILLDQQPMLTETVTGSSSDTPDVVELPDGSRVFLNQQARLVFPRTFGDVRKVELQGEAFFEVTHNPEKPFIIEAGDARVKVLGTSFNVLAPEKQKEVEVFVETGKVQLSGKNREEEAVVLEQGNVGKLSGYGLIKYQNTDKNYMAWKTRNLIFDNTSLKDVAGILNRVYQVNLEYQDTALQNYRINSTFSNQDIDFVMEVICKTLNLEAERKSPGTILLKHKQ